MLENRLKSTSFSNDKIKSIELKVLNAMKCESYEFQNVPSEIQDLTCGQLCIPTPKIIPFVRLLLQSILSTINDTGDLRPGSRLLWAVFKMNFVEPELHFRRSY